MGWVDKFNRRLKYQSVRWQVFLSGSLPTGFLNLQNFTRMIYIWFFSFGAYLIYSVIQNHFAQAKPEASAAADTTEDPIVRWLNEQDILASVLGQGPVRVYGFDFNLLSCRINVELRHDPGVPVHRVKITFPLFFPEAQKHIVAACLSTLNRRLTGVAFRLVTSRQRSVILLSCDELTDAEGNPVKRFDPDDLYRIFAIADQCFPEIHRAVFNDHHPELVAIRAFGPEDFRLN